MQRTITGRYIHKSDNLCQSPSNAIILPWYSGLSAITKKAKHNKEKAKQIKEKIPKNLLKALKKYSPINNGANSKSINPIADPYPCIFVEIVFSSLVSPTEKKPDKIQAPMA